MKLSTSLLLWFLTLASNVHAHVTVSDGWIRATAPSQQVAAGYMRIVAGHDTHLVGGASFVAGEVEIHKTEVEGGVSTMTRLQELHLRKNVPVAFEPRGVHLMFVKLVKPLNAGERVSVRLDFRNSDGQTYAQDFVFEVRALAPPSAGAGKAVEHRH